MTPSSPSADQQAIHQPVSMERHRFHLLDALRGLAAIVVVIFHAPEFYRRVLHFPNSFLAVDFFFCLSGFVIAFSYESRLKTKMTTRDFVVIRLIRLYPLYLLGSAIGLLRRIFIAHQTSGSKFGLAELLGCAALLIPNLTQRAYDAPIFPLDHPAWSLFFEMIANVVYALLVPLRNAARLFLVLALASLAFLTLIGSTIDRGIAWDGLSTGLARVGFSFLAGVLLFQLYTRRSALRLQGSRSLAIAALVSLLLLAPLLLYPTWSATHTYQILVVAFIFPTVVYVGARCALPQWLTGICAFLGDASYPLYMLHVPLALAYADAKAAPAILMHHPSLIPWVVPFYVAIMVPFSWLIGRSFDLSIRKRLTAIYKASQSNSSLRHRTA